MNSSITFERWIKAVFDHPVTELEWYWDDDVDLWTEAEWKAWTPALSVDLLTQTCERSGEVLRAFSDAQVNQGWRFLFIDEYWFNVLDGSVLWPDRKRCIRSIYTLFEHCFAPRCSPHLSHLDERSANPLNSVCYMWWDRFPAYGQPQDPARAEVDSKFLDVMRRTLNLNSSACRESALHGLGHWSIDYAEATTIIDDFLIRTPNLSRALKEYALQARVGAVQ